MKFTLPTISLIVAPTCSGKSYLLEHLVHKGLFSRVVGSTTRPPRDNEVDGKDYEFLSKERFHELLELGEFTQTVTFNGNSYGVTKSALKKAANSGGSPIIIVEPTGIAQYEQFANQNGWRIFKVFVYLPQHECIRRLNDRTTRQLTLATTYEGRQKIVTDHSIRLRSMIVDETGWSAKSNWNTVVPGDDVEGAELLIRGAIYQANRRVADGTTV
jgi:guanylate kinase